MNNRERNIVFDALKALAIFLVVYAHSIQYIGVNDYWTNPVFQFIYSFHMPLFFMISGFFFSSALRLGLKDFLKKKGVTLLLPCFVWAFIYGGIQFTSWEEYVQKIVNPLQWPFWFLKGLFLVQLIVYACTRVSARIGKGKYELAFAVFISAIIYVLPFMSVPRIMIPMFWGGYLIRLYYEQFEAHYKLIGIISLVVFGVLCVFWNTEGMTYYAGALPKAYEIIGHMKGYTWHDGLIIVYRIAVGLSGSVAIIALMHCVKQIPKSVALVGASTQDIYIFQSLILETLLGHFISFKSMNCYVVVPIILPIMTLLIIGACMLISRLVKRNNIMACVLLGKVPSPKNQNTEIK